MPRAVRVQARTCRHQVLPPGSALMPVLSCRLLLSLLLLLLVLPSSGD
jgi:hypothetical protein